MRVIEEIIKQGMVRVAFPDPDATHVFCWSENAEDQLSALLQQILNEHTKAERQALVNIRQAVRSATFDQECTPTELNVLRYCDEALGEKV